MHTALKYSISSDGVFTQENNVDVWFVEEKINFSWGGTLDDPPKWDIIETKEKNQDYHTSIITGPLAWALQLGPIAAKRYGSGYGTVPDIPSYSMHDVLTRLINGDNWYDYAQTALDIESPWISAVPLDEGADSQDRGGLFTEHYQKVLGSNGPDASSDGYGRDFASKYMYQTNNWSKALNTWFDTTADWNKITSDRTEPNFTPYNNYLWLSKDTDISIDEVEADTKYSLGYKIDKKYNVSGGTSGSGSSGPGDTSTGHPGFSKTEEPRYGTVNISAISTTTLYPRLTTNGAIEPDSNSKSPFKTGQTLFYLPFLEQNNRDPWSFKSKFNFSTNNLGNAFRTLLGESLASPTIGKRFTLSHVPDFIDDSSGDFEESIDWSNLNRFTFPFTGGHYFTLVVDQEINFLKLMAEELKLFGIHMTREWDGTANTFVYRFHRIGVMNGSVAYSENRYLNDTNLERSAVREDHNDTWLFNQANVKLNWNGESFESPELIVKDVSGFGSIGTVDRTFKVESKLTNIRNLKEISKSQWPELKKHIANNILVNMLRPMPTYSFEAGLNAALMLSVGKEVSVTDSSAAQPYTHEPGLTENVCLITEMSINWGRGKVRGKYRVGDKIEYGIAPAMLVQAGNSSIGVDNVTITPDEHEYTDTDDRKDLSFFDCIGWNKSTRSYANLDCSCSDYRVICYEKNSKDPTVIVATVSDVDMTAGTALLTNDADTIDSLWDTAKDWIIVYGTSDDANTQDCQLRWTYQADPRDGLIDTATSTQRARKWK
jgi:hypothetical protein